MRLLEKTFKGKPYFRLVLSEDEAIYMERRNNCSPIISAKREYATFSLLNINSNSKRKINMFEKLESRIPEYVFELNDTGYRELMRKAEVCEKCRSFRVKIKVKD